MIVRSSGAKSISQSLYVTQHAQQDPRLLERPTVSPPLRMLSPTAATFVVEMAGTTAAEDTQITVRFSTKLPDAYRVPGDPVVSAAAAHVHVMCRRDCRLQLA